MKSLANKMQGSAPNISAQIGTDFQAFIMREREQFKKSVYQVEKEGTVDMSQL